MNFATILSGITLVTILFLVFLSSSWLILVLHLAFSTDESSLSFIYLATDFLGLLGYLLDSISAELVEELLVEESELSSKVLIPLLFVCLLLLSVNRAQVLVGSTLLLGRILRDCFRAWAWFLSLKLQELLLSEVEWSF